MLTINIKPVNESCNTRLYKMAILLRQACINVGEYKAMKKLYEAIDVINKVNGTKYSLRRSEYGYDLVFSDNRIRYNERDTFMFRAPKRLDIPAVKEAVEKKMRQFEEDMETDGYALYTGYIEKGIEQTIGRDREYTARDFKDMKKQLRTYLETLICAVELLEFKEHNEIDV